VDFPSNVYAIFYGPNYERESQKDRRD